MKMSNDTGPQVLPTSFGPSYKIGIDSGPQINGGPNGGFTPTMKPGEDFTGPQVSFTPGGQKPVEDFTGPQVFYGGVAAGQQYGRSQLIQERTPPRNTRFFPATTGMGGASIRTVDAYQGGPAGRMNAFRVRSGWTWGM